MRTLCTLVVSGLIAIPVAGIAASQDPLLEARQNYRNYQAAAEQTGRKLPRSSKAVSQAVKRLTEYKSKDLGSGWIAEGALRASRDPAFKSGVMQAVELAGGKDKFASLLKTDPMSVMKITGSGNGMRAVFDNIKLQDQYYDWLSGSLTAIAQGKKATIAPLVGPMVIPRPKPGQASTAKSVQVNQNVKAPLHSMGQRSNLSVVGRMMVLAALDIAGTTRSGDGNPKIHALLNSSPMTACLDLARQNLRQCLAASRGKSEKQFCTGQHAVGEVSGCFDWILPPDY